MPRVTKVLPWTRELVALSGLRRNVRKRQLAAYSRYVAILKALPPGAEITAEVLRAHGIRRGSEHNAIKAMVAYGLIKRARRVPQHTVYHVIQGALD